MYIYDKSHQRLIASGPKTCPSKGKGFEYMSDTVLLQLVEIVLLRLVDIVLVFLVQKVGKGFLFSIIFHFPSTGRGFFLCDGL